MVFHKMPLGGAYVIGLDRIEDERGFFARSWCVKEFQEHGLNPNFVQCNVSLSKKKRTLRGMHYQVSPHEEAKFVRCTKGAIYDVIIDLRPASATYKQWIGIELTAENRKALYSPEGFAHGFQTLEDDTEVLYAVTESYHPESEKGVRFNDPAFGIEWPLPNPILSLKDSRHKEFVS